MFESPHAIPITVTAAVVIFILRELLEGHRRRTANNRKLAAIKNQLASECERTNWAIRWIRSAISDIRTALEYRKDIKIETNFSGNRRLVFINEDGDSSSLVPKAYSQVIDKYLFEVASLDSRLFAKMVDSLAGLAELNHVLESLVEYVEETGQPWLEGWCDYASREVGISEEPILYLYEACTGLALTKTRLR